MMTDEALAVTRKMYAIKNKIDTLDKEYDSLKKELLLVLSSRDDYSSKKDFSVALSKDISLKHRANARVNLDQDYCLEHKDALVKEGFLGQDKLFAETVKLSHIQHWDLDRFHKSHPGVVQVKFVAPSILFADKNEFIFIRRK
jgi:hypothetical protein